jgi:hypothetical protein
VIAAAGEWFFYLCPGARSPWLDALGGTEFCLLSARRPPPVVEDWHGAVASDTARGSGPCTSGVIMSQGFPMSPLRDWIW